MRKAIALAVCLLTAFSHPHVFATPSKTRTSSFATQTQEVTDAFSYLTSRMDAYQWDPFTTPRLIETYTVPYPPFAQFRADVYSNAIAILAFLQRAETNDLDRAKILADGLGYVQDIDPLTDGRIRDAYWATDLTAPDGGPSIFEPGSSSGNLAWAIIALTELYQVDPAQHAPYLDTALALGSFIVTTYKDLEGYGGFKAGYMTDWLNPPDFITMNHAKSTEQNVDLSVAFHRLYEATDDPAWLTEADHALQFIMNMRDGEEGSYWVGTLPDGDTEILNTELAQQALDANVYPVFLGLGKQHTDWITDNMYTESDGYVGFDFNTDHDGVWFEGVAVVSLAHALYSRQERYHSLLDQLRLNQSNTAVTYPYAVGALTSASHDDLSTGFGWFYYNSPDITATSWYILAEYRFIPLLVHPEE